MPNGSGPHPSPHSTVPSIEPYVGDWSRHARQLARALVHQYDLPHEATESMLIWYNQDPWKRIVLHQHGAPHNFPKEHVDLLEQTIDYKVPLEKVEEVLAFDGSILIDRTKGEVTVCCGDESMNILTLNLANDVILGKRTVEGARDVFGACIAAASMNWPLKNAKELQFKTDAIADTLGNVRSETANPDQALTGSPIARAARRVFR